MHWAYPLLPSHHLLSPRLCHSLPTGTVLTHEHPLAPVYSRSAGTRVMKRMLSFALSFPRRELQQIISICHQINRFQNEHFPHSPEGNRSIHLSVRQAGLHIQTCIWTKANLNSTYIFCVTPKQPKPPFPQGEGRPISVLSSCQHQVSTICQAIHWMPTGNDWLALQGWHTVLLTPSQEREAVFQERCHKPRWCWWEAVDLSLRLNTQGHSPLLMGPAGHMRSPAQAMHPVQRSRINLLGCQLHPRC